MFCNKRICNKRIHPGDLVRYLPSQVHTNEFDPSTDDVVPGSIGICISLGSSWEVFLNGLEPYNVLFSGGVTRVYRDELEILCP